MTELYYGCGSQEQFDEYIDFINYIFGFNGNEEDFKKLLPLKIVYTIVEQKGAVNILLPGYLPAYIEAVRIHGRVGDENLMIEVKNQVVTVEESEGAPVAELSHLEAMRFVFAPVCEKRRYMPAFVQCWFPLPLWIYAADNV